MLQLETSSDDSYSPFDGNFQVRVGKNDRDINENTAAVHDVVVETTSPLSITLLRIPTCLCRSFLNITGCSIERIYQSTSIL